MSDDPKPSSLLRTFMRWSILVALALILGLAALVAVRPEKLVFYPEPEIEHTPAELGLDFEEVEVRTEDGETLHGWYVPAPGGGPLADRRAVVLYSHGNAGNIGGRLYAIEGIVALGLPVLIFDYRGYGRSSGRPTVAGTRLDIAAMWSELRDQRGFAPEQIVLWGRSLGGAVAIDQAARADAHGERPAALIVESSFTSTLDMAKERYPWLPAKPLARRLDYPSRRLIATVDAPTLIAHSPTDEVVPYAHGQALHAAAGQPGPFVELSGGHNEGHLSKAGHREQLVSFLRAHLATR